MLPEPLDLAEINRLLHSTTQSNESHSTDFHMTMVAEKNHVASDRRFGSFWNYKTQGLFLCNTFNTFEDQDASNNPLHTLSTSGPGMRFLQFMPGVCPPDRAQHSEHYSACRSTAHSQAAQITRHLTRGRYAVYPIHMMDAETPFVFRMGPRKNEPDDGKLIQKVHDFHAFVIKTNGDAFNRAVAKHQVRKIEKPRNYPALPRDITMPPLCAADGSVVTSAPVGGLDEFVPEIAQNKMQKFVVFSMHPTPTLLNCINESKYLRESMPASPLGRGDYDEALIIQPMQAFYTPEKAHEFKDNFVKHTLLTGSIHVVSTNEIIPFLHLYTEWARQVIPRTYRKQTVQTAAVTMPDNAAVRRELASSAGVEMVHLGPEQTEEEAQAAMDKLQRVHRANARIAKTNELFRRLAVKREAVENATTTSGSAPLPSICEANESCGGGGGSKESSCGGGGGGSKE